MEFPHIAGFAEFLQVVAIDLTLAGDNAVVIGLAAAGLPAALRPRAIFFGILVATAIRVGFSLVATQILQIVGLLMAGGILLLWVCWKMWQELRGSAQASLQASVAASALADPEAPDIPGRRHPGEKTLRSAVTQIVVADISMSLDNVLAVAGAARHHPTILVFGLALSIALMGIAATAIASLLQKYHWIAYIGLAIILYVALEMIFHGSREVLADPGVRQMIGDTFPALAP